MSDQERIRELEKRLAHAEAMIQTRRHATTDAVNGETARRELGNVFNEFFDHAVTPLVWLDRDYDFIRVNEAYAKACQRAVSDFPGHNHFEFYPSEAKAVFDRVVASKSPYQAMEHPFVFPDHPEWGVTYWDWVLEPILDERGEVEYLFFSLNDVTERKRAEEALRRSQQMFQRLFEGAPYAKVLVNRTGRIVRVNTQAEALFGYRRDELEGQGIEVLLPEPVRARHAAHFAAYFAAPHARPMGAGLELLGRRKGGGEFSADIMLSPIETDEGLQALAVIRDTTEHRRAELEAQTLRQELAHTTRVMTMGELAAGLAHELNQPLTAILTNTQAAQRLLAAGPSNVADLPEILADIVSDVQRAGDVIQRMRAMLKKKKRESLPVDLNSVVREVAWLFRSEALLREVTVRLELAPELPCVHADRVQLQQVILNLVKNALDAMREGSLRDRRLWLRTSRGAAHTVRLTVEDSGGGIPADRLERVFEPFFSTKAEGLGLGLSLSRSIIEAHGGCLQATNNDGGGATFEVSLPVGEGEAP